MWNSNWAVCSTQLEPGTVIIVPSSSVRQEKSVSWQATGILMIVCNMLWMMNKWVRVQTCFWVRDWTAPIADTLLPEQGHRSDCSIFPLLLSITFTASAFVGIAGWVTVLACFNPCIVVCHNTTQYHSQLYLKTTAMSNSLPWVLLLLTFLCLSIPCAASLFQARQIQSVCSHLHRNLSSRRPQRLRVIVLLPSILGSSMNGIHIPLLPCSLTCLTSATLSKPQSQKSLSCGK